MYPARVLELFPPFPRRNEVFVIMSFDARFRHRWENVVVPAVGRIAIDGVPLRPVRADPRTVSDSIVTDIITGISNARLVLVDVTTMGIMDGTPIRNGSVMYEVGLAQAVRQPEEVILLRSDNARIIFDISIVRILSYDPDGDPRGAVDFVRDIITFGAS